MAVLLGVASFLTVKAQLTTSNVLTPAQLVQNVLLGPGIIASNITYTGYTNAIGWFHNGNAGSPGLGIDSGIVMTNGTILANDPTYGPGAGPQGPNNSSGAGVNNNAPGDTYLDVVAGTNTFNACVLEFDFIAQADSVKFNYVFGTDEYMEYVSGGFADVFAFVLSGVSTTLAPTNIALIPNTTTPVTALNVNANVNPTYYVDNENPPGTVCQYDGFTVVLQAKYPILCGETYHIKLACADALDGIVDGGVFLQAGSFTTGQVNLSSEISYGSNNDSTLYEGCGQACIILARQGGLNLADTVSLVIGGTTLNNGTDFIPQIPATVIFQPGQDSIVLCLSALQDGVPEGLETLTISSTVTGPCVQSVNSLTIYISDFLPITVDAGPDTSLCTAAPITLNALTSGGVEPYAYVWSNGALTQSITVSPTVTTTYIVSVTDPCGSPTGFDTVTIYLPSGNPLNTFPTPDLSLCSGDPALIAVTAIDGSLPYTYNWATIAGPQILPNPTGNSNSFTPSASGTYVVVTRDGCNVLRLDTITVNVQECDVIPPNVFTPNGDGTNDNLVFFGLENFPGTALSIYNRWGNKIYEDADYQNDWNGSGISDGTYYYVLLKSDGTAMTGFIMVIK
ncbi:MAG: choice-of-anchor L domain-containing protein [Bacteroidota bacterium]|nr:choice-of-anchor L domain-containing protein [Bacteroidota bacterium]